MTTIKLRGIATASFRTALRALDKFQFKFLIEIVAQKRFGRLLVLLLFPLQRRCRSQLCGFSCHKLLPGNRE